MHCIGCIYPVCDLTACTWGVSFANMSKIYARSEADMTAPLPRNNPVEQLASLTAHKIPIFHLTGDKNTAVPMEKHSLELQKRYRALGGEMEVQIIPGKGHAVIPEYFQSQRMLDFILKYGLHERE